MDYLRAAARGVTIVATTGLFFLIWLLGLPFVAFSERPRSAWRYFFFRTTSRALLALMGARVESSGEAPRAPYVLVANHQSYVDVLILASLLDAIFVSKAEVAHWPVLGPICRAMGTIFIDRATRRDVSRVLGRMHAVLTAGHGVVLFPEGTSTDGSEVRRFRPSLLETAVRLDQPVSYASLRYATGPGAPPAREAVCWWGDAAFIPHICRLLMLRGFDARIVFGSRPIECADRKILAERLREAVAGQLSPAEARG